MKKNILLSGLISIASLLFGPQVASAQTISGEILYNDSPTQILTGTVTIAFNSTDLYSSFTQTTYVIASLDIPPNGSVSAYSFALPTTTGYSNPSFAGFSGLSYSYSIKAAVAPNSASVTIPFGSPWFPSLSGGVGGGANLFVVSYVVNWRESPWTPSSLGSFTFYVASRPQPGYTGNVTDPIQGSLVLNPIPYTVTVVPASMIAPVSANSVAYVGQPWLPSSVGGSGGTTRLFTVAYQVNWQAGPWTPSRPGTYMFYVGLIPNYGYQGNATDPIQGSMQVNFTPYTVTVY